MDGETEFIAQINLKSDLISIEKYKIQSSNINLLTISVIMTLHKIKDPFYISGYRDQISQTKYNK